MWKLRCKTCRHRAQLGVSNWDFQIPETLSPEILAKMHSPGPDESVPEADVHKLTDYDGFLIGVPTRWATFTVCCHVHCLKCLFCASLTMMVSSSASQSDKPPFFADFVLHSFRYDCMRCPCYIHSH